MSAWLAVVAVAAIGGVFWTLDHLRTRKHLSAGADKWKAHQTEARDTTGAETGGWGPGVGGPDAGGDGGGGDGGGE